MCGYVASLALMLIGTGALAQSEVVARNMYTERTSQDNKLTFCYNGFNALSEFEQDLAQALGDALLTEVTLFTYKEGDLQSTPTSYDYRLPVSDEQIFVLLAQNCDAFMGYVANTNAPEWMKVTQPYINVESILFSANPDIHRVADLTPPVRVGIRMTTPGDSQLISYVNSTPGWSRTPYHDNGRVVERVLDGSTTLGMIWRQGFYLARHDMGDDPKIFALDDLPFVARTSAIGIATRGQDGYLNTMLNDAIAALMADGTIEALQIKHHMLPEG
ncbi:extracellular solute-binding protein [Ketogulonicigenium robustum]|uniref:Extracellular solute-binding protein n=2 Tax=Ketogulonicigenium robustum TaxID=92947 RepID=A0A1W6P244_9RHOB|nr:extracellular solute-binding protein [Ketogulonicigenium robustum]